MTFFVLLNFLPGARYSERALPLSASTWEGAEADMALLCEGLGAEGIKSALLIQASEVRQFDVTAWARARAEAEHRARESESQGRATRAEECADARAQMQQPGAATL